MRLDRRSMIRTGAAALAFGGLARSASAQTASAVGPDPAAESYANEVFGYGPLRADPGRILDLPDGFSYRVISRAGDAMDDGLVVPGKFDGMGCFSTGGSTVTLVRNHELKTSSPGHLPLGAWGADRTPAVQATTDAAYDHDSAGRPLLGGTTTLVYDLKTGRTVSQHLSLGGTSTNCGGGQTPWGTWLTCEEIEESPADADVSKAHGYVFEVPANGTGPAPAVPLTAMGRFCHEAVCIDPRSGIAYLTEDKTDGLFYRFLPDRPGELARGGRLQAMAFKDQRSADSSNLVDRAWSPGDWRDVVWIDLDEVESPAGDLRGRGHAAGALRVSRGEGIHWGVGEMYLTATSGGPIGRGQILRYVPSPSEGQNDEVRQPGRVQLFLESSDVKIFNMGDNLTVAPNGHLIVCEDNYSEVTFNHLKGVTPDGRSYTLGRNAYIGNSEFAGAVFAPDGKTLFVNIQTPGLTLAIEGPWGSVR